MSSNSNEIINIGVGNCGINVLDSVFSQLTAESEINTDSCLK